jgi:hypothetical protein
MKYSVNPIAPVSKGFLKEFVDYAAAKGEITKADLIKEFAGKQRRSKSNEPVVVTPKRIARYAAWCVYNGVFFVQ